MVRRKVYRNKRSPVTGRRTRYQLWIQLGENRKRARPARRTPSPAEQAWTTITTFLRSVSGGTRRKTTTRRKGRHTTDLHPQLYRRAAPRQSTRPPDEVARMRQRRRNRGRR